MPHTRTQARMPHTHTHSSDRESLSFLRLFGKMPTVVLRRLTRKTSVRCRIRGKQPEKARMTIRRRMIAKQRDIARPIATPAKSTERHNMKSHRAKSTKQNVQHYVVQNKNPTVDGIKFATSMK